MKRYQDFLNESRLIRLNEGGNAIKINVRPIKQTEIEATLNDFETKIFSKLGLEKEDWCLLGSAGKKLPNEVSGDLDLGISLFKICDALNCSIEDLFESLSEFFTKNFPTLEINPMKGMFVFSVGFPIVPFDGNVVQVDLMPTDDLDWSKFIYHSPDFRQMESKYKGLHRNMLIKSILSILYYEDLGDGTFKKMTLNYNKGLLRTHKTTIGKRGNPVKIPQKIDDTFITKNPDELVRLTLGESYTRKDFNSFESIWNIISNRKWEHFDKLDSIVEKAKSICEREEYPLPSELIEY